MCAVGGGAGERGGGGRAQKIKTICPETGRPETVGQTDLTSIQLPLAVCFPGLKACDVSSPRAE